MQRNDGDERDPLVANVSKDMKRRQRFRDRETSEKFERQRENVAAGSKVKESHVRTKKASQRNSKRHMHESKEERMDSATHKHRDEEVACKLKARAEDEENADAVDRDLTKKKKHQTAGNGDDRRSNMRIYYTVTDSVRPGSVVRVKTTEGHDVVTVVPRDAKTNDCIAVDVVSTSDSSSTVFEAVKRFLGKQSDKSYTDANASTMRNENERADTKIPKSVLNTSLDERSTTADAAIVNVCDATDEEEKSDHERTNSKHETGNASDEERYDNERTELKYDDCAASSPVKSTHPLVQIFHIDLALPSFRASVEEEDDVTRRFHRCPMDQSRRFRRVKHDRRNEMTDAFEEYFQ